MKKIALGILLTLSSMAFATGTAPQDAYGACYHFYNCQGITFPGGYVSLDQCAQEGGLSVLEGGYCENVAPEETAKFSPRWFGNCYYSIGCIGMSMGSMSDSQCQSMGGHSIDAGGGACINL